MYAHCFRSGHIELSELPDIEGGICIGEGTKDELTRKLDGRARMSWNDTWLVPGVPEAETGDAALDATIRFKTRMDEPLPEAG
ncbi:host nuclease inhibitor protein [Ruegeria faecimaris]|uniref:host nuclease inhibitor protein n=1 Tax=Ruegeria faecimaris TaxID=686389 RepID=UPI00232D6B15|nr:host nuclease inhibitor protein [Ruegeria faecimaris]